ncbi:MAG: methyltransferase [Gammaproteobacteria bacterium]|nr:methyltransferase [Gammaproteobacteria bacterium]MBU1444342.1 methyltransferase [Gammaproteobacteria bacterium]
MPALRDTAPPSRLGAWSERWSAWRDRLLSSPAFRRRAAAFPFTAPIARRSASQLFDLVAGFVYSQVLHACVKLDLFELLAEGAQDVRTISGRLGLPLESTERLLDAGVALRLFERRGRDRYGLGPLGAPMVGNDAIAAMVRHHAALYADLADPVAFLRERPAQTALGQYWPYADASAPEGLAAASVAAYSDLMTASQPLVADEILDAYPIGRHRALLDVGGGEGAFLISAAARVPPSTKLMLFDLPAVAERARRRCAASGLGHRIDVYAGSFLDDELPAGADIATLVRVVHDHDDAAALRILRAVRRALGTDGVLLVAEPMARTRGAERMGDAYFGIYLFAMGSGKPRTQAALTALLHEAGFDRVQALRTRMPLQTGLLVARVARTTEAAP